MSGRSDPFVSLFFSEKQLRSYYVFGNDPNVVSDSILGRVGERDPISLKSFMEMAYSGIELPSFVSPRDNKSTGILGTIPTRFWLNYSLGNGINGFQPVPLLKKAAQNAGDLDDFISDSMENVLKKISSLDKSSVTDAKADGSKIEAFFLSIADYLANLPHGGVFFSKLSHEEKIYDWVYNIGMERRLATTSNFPPMGIRQLYLQTALDNGILRNGNISVLGDAQITQGYRVMPELRSTKVDFPFDGLIGSILYPLGISFLLPIFVVTLVREKENKIAIMMKMNGLKMSVYYLSHSGNYLIYVSYILVTFFILSAISLTAFVIAGIKFNLSMFTKTDIFVIIVTLFLWTIVQISLAFFFASLFNSSRIANISVILIVLCSVIISLGIDNLYPDDPLSYAYFIWPPFAFYRVLGIINRSSFSLFTRVSAQY